MCGIRQKTGAMGSKTYVGKWSPKEGYLGRRHKKSLQKESKKDLGDTAVTETEIYDFFIFTIFTYFLKFYNRYVWVHRLQVLLTCLDIDMYTYKYILSLQAVYLKCIKYCNLKRAGLLARNNSRRCCHCTSHHAVLHAQCLVNAHKHGEKQRARAQTRDEGSVHWDDLNCSMKDQGRHLWHWQWCLNLDGEKNHSVIPIATILNLFRLYPSHS